MQALKEGKLKMSCEDPDNPKLAAQHVRLALQPAGSSGKGHEYFLKHLLGTSNGVQGKDLARTRPSPPRWSWHDKAPEGKLTCW